METTWRLGFAVFIIIGLVAAILLLPGTAHAAKAEEVKTLLVPSKNSTNTTVTLTPGTYLLEASGYWQFIASWNPRGKADAGFSARNDSYAYKYSDGTFYLWDTGTPRVDGWCANLFTGNVRNYLELWYSANNESLHPLVGDLSTDFRANHTYTRTITITDYPLRFRIFDDNYADNTGGINVTLYKYPSANFTSNVTEGDAPLTVQFNNTSVGANITIIGWSFGDGTANSTEANPVHMYEEPGEYNVTLTVGNYAGTNTKQTISMITVSEPEPTPTPAPEEVEGQSWIHMELLYVGAVVGIISAFVPIIGGNKK